MEYERKLKITGNEEVVLAYYIVKCYSRTFECEMYNVGIKSSKKNKEINDFSPSYVQAKELCDYLYTNHVSCENLFLVAEEFIEKI